MTASNAYFSCSNMHSYYGESYIVQGVGFQIQKGEIVALSGAMARARRPPCGLLPDWTHPAFSKARYGSMDNPFTP